MTIQELIERLESYYEFECPGGPLKNCMEWQQLKAACASGSPAPTIPEAAGENEARLGRIWNRLGWDAQASLMLNGDGLDPIIIELRELTALRDQVARLDQQNRELHDNREFSVQVIEELKGYVARLEQERDALLDQQVLKDVKEIFSSYGYLLMRIAVAKDAQDAYDVVRAEFTEADETLQRLETALRMVPIQRPKDHVTLQARAEQAEARLLALQTAIRETATDWAQQAQALADRRGQMTREKRGHEVLANCAADLDALLIAQQPAGAVPEPSA